MSLGPFRPSAEEPPPFGIEARRLPSALPEASRPGRKKEEEEGCIRRPITAGSVLGKPRALCLLVR